MDTDHYRVIMKSVSLWNRQRGEDSWAYPNLRNADLQSVDLSEANLRYTDLQGANLQHANLYRTDLKGANLRNADLWCARLRETDLRGVKGFLFLPNIDPLHGYDSYLTIADDGEFLVCIGRQRIRLPDVEKTMRWAEFGLCLAAHYRWMMSFINHCTVSDLGRIIPPKMEFKLAEGVAS